MTTTTAVVSRELLSSLQVISDGWLAWQLQAEEYKKYYKLTSQSMPSTFLKSQSSTSPLYQFQNAQGETISFSLRPTSINGDCFFDAVNRGGFNRDTLVKKLLENPTELVRTVFGHEIRQFLYLGYTGSHPNKQENQACQQLLTLRIRRLFFALQEAEATLRPMVDAVRSELGARETHQKKPPELLGLLRQRDSRLTQKFEEVYQAVLNADKAIYEYCCETEVFKNYVTLYLKEARGYIPFSRDFGGAVPTTTIDVINQLFGLKIQVYLPLNARGTQLQLANQFQTGEAIPIFHNGINHFWGLIFSSNTASNEIKHDDLKKEEKDSNLLHQDSGISGDVTIHLSSLPSIPYNREELNEIIEEIPMGSDIQAKVSSYLENIEKQVSAIQKYQAKKKPENFYESMCLATSEIRNTAKALYELIKAYHPSFPNTLKELLLKWIIPLEAALEKRLEMPVDDREALVLKTKHLYAEQSFISRQPDLQQVLMEHLGKVKALLLESNHPNPRCYISYAWPSKENKAQEYWVQPFLYVLYDHLTAAGIRVVMDIRDNKPGESIYQFMKQYHDGNYIILVGTESLLQKHYAVIPHAVQTELSIISNRSERDQRQFGQSRIYPMLISGTLKTAYPERYQLYSTVRDAREQGYLGTLKKLTDWIYDDRVKVEKHKHANLWRTFNEACPGLSKESKTVKEEIAIGYHRQRLDYLKQDVQYQSVEAQEKTQHSQAVEAEQISVLVKSQGTNPQTLFDENGQQFQKPYANPNFVQRSILWDGIKQYFAKADQQILILTAHGLGGCGKSELAKYYYLHPPKPYKLRAWFQATHREQLYVQYIELALQNGIKFAEEMPINQKAIHVKNWLEQERGCLLVYDNVPDEKTLEELLPNKGQHHILITSRNEGAWPVYQKLLVGVMEKEEAIELIVQITKVQSEYFELQELAKVLGYLPLAIAQAGAYIFHRKITISKYLALYKENEKEMLAYKRLPASSKHDPVLITWNISIKAVQNEAIEFDIPPLAPMLLLPCACLFSEKIPRVLLSSWFEKIYPESPSNIIDELLGQLHKFSLINLNNEDISVHHLVQAVIRINYKDGVLKQLNSNFLTIKSHWFPELLNIIHEAYFRIKNKNEKRKLWPHMNALVVNLNHFLETDLKSSLAFLNLLNDIVEISSDYRKSPISTRIVEYIEQKFNSIDSKILKLKQLKLSNEKASVQKIIQIRSQLENISEGFFHLKTDFLNRMNKTMQYPFLVPGVIDLVETYIGKEMLIRLEKIDAGLGTMIISMMRYTEQNPIESQLSIQSLNNLDVAMLYKIFDSFFKNFPDSISEENKDFIPMLSNLKDLLLELKEPMELAMQDFKIKKKTKEDLTLEFISALSNIDDEDFENYYEFKFQPEALDYLERLRDKIGTKDNIIIKNNIVFFRTSWLRKLSYQEIYNLIENLKVDSNNFILRNAAEAREGSKETIVVNKNNFKEIFQFIEQTNNNAIYAENFKKTIPLFNKFFSSIMQVINLKLKQELEKIEKSTPLYHQLEEYLQKLSSINFSLPLTANQQPTIVENTPLITTLENGTENSSSIEPAARPGGSATSLDIHQLSQEGIKHYRAQEYKEAIKFFQQALSLQQQINSTPNEELAMLYFNIGSAYLLQKDYEPARTALQSAYDMRLTLLGASHAATQKAQSRLQECHHAIEQYVTSNKMASESETENLSSIEPATRPVVSTTGLGVQELSQEGMKHYRAQEYKEAIEFFQQALSFRQQTNSSPHEEVATLHFNIGSAYLLQKNYLSARTSLQSAYDMRLALLGASHATTQKAQTRLQECQHMIEQHATSSEIKLENETEHSSAMESTAPLIFSTTSLDVHQFSQEGMKHYRAQEYKEAIEFFQQALRLQQQMSNTPSEEMATLHFNIGSAYFLQKDYLLAKTSLQSAYDMRLTLLGASHAATQKAQTRLQECQRAIEEHTTFTPKPSLIKGDK